MAEKTRYKRAVLGSGAMLLVVFSAFPAFAQQEKVPEFPNRLGVGDTVPGMDFEDVYGEKFSNKLYWDWIIVYSFADRLSNNELRKIIGPAGIEVVKAHPELKIVYISVADLIVVPTIFREMIIPILKKIYDNTTEQLQEAYKIWRVPLREERSRFFMIPDMAGSHLKTFGLENAKKYHTFVVYKSRIHAVFDTDNPPYVDFYLPVIDKLAKSIPAEEKLPVPKGERN